MIELPEAEVLCSQIRTTCRGKTITGVEAGLTPHKLTWFYGDPAAYRSLLVGRRIEEAAPAGGLVRIEAEGAVLLFGEGLRLRRHAPGEPRPAKRQFLLDFDDGSSLSSVTQMYGGLGAFKEGELDNPYYLIARKKPSPLTSAFDRIWFDSLFADPGLAKKSLKFCLATEQRIPGLGNGVLQDILFEARLHPKRKWETLNAEERDGLFGAVKRVLAAMAAQGGRDTEGDLFGKPGGYATILCAATATSPCPRCGGEIVKEAYMGGSVYYCRRCQAQTS
jgi:formamidopyrimidine-DNA glycosylase